MSEPIVHEMFDDIFVGADRDWVNPTATREKLVTPYAFDAFFVWRLGDVTRAETLDIRTLYDETRALVATVNAGITGDWSKASTGQVNEFLKQYSNRSIHATALAEFCDFKTGAPYWVLYFKESR